jgi:hypothetical protein
LKKLGTIAPEELVFLDRSDHADDEGVVTTAIGGT